MKPPVFGEQLKNSRGTNGLAALEKKRKKDKKPVIFSAAKDSDIRIVAEYITLKKERGLVVNLAAIAKEAHALSLSEESFINWVIATINKRLTAHFIVVRELDALAYIDQPGKKGKKASVKKNLRAIMEKLEGFVVFAATPAQDYLIQDNDFEHYLVEPMTFDLWQIQAIVKKAMDLNKTPDDKEPLMTIARIVRGARSTFSLGLLHDGLKQFSKSAKTKTTLTERRAVAEEVGRTLMKKESTDTINAILTSHIDTIEQGLEKNGTLYFAQRPRIDNPNNTSGMILSGEAVRMTDLAKVEKRANDYAKELAELINLDIAGNAEGVLQAARLHADNLAEGERNAAIGRENASADNVRENLLLHINAQIAHAKDEARELANKTQQKAHDDAVELLEQVIEDMVDNKRLDAVAAELRLNQQELGEDFYQRLAAAYHHHEDKHAHALETLDLLGTWTEEELGRLDQHNKALREHLRPMLAHIMTVRHALITYRQELVAHNIPVPPMRVMLDEVVKMLNNPVQPAHWPQNIRDAALFLWDVQNP